RTIPGADGNRHRRARSSPARTGARQAHEFVDVGGAPEAVDGEMMRDRPRTLVGDPPAEPGRGQAGCAAELQHADRTTMQTHEDPLLAKRSRRDRWQRRLEIDAHEL